MSAFELVRKGPHSSELAGEGKLVIHILLTSSNGGLTIRTQHCGARSNLTADSNSAVLCHCRRLRQNSWDYAFDNRHGVFALVRAHSDRPGRALQGSDPRLSARTI